MKLSEKSKNDIKLLQRTQCCDMIRFEETLTNENKDNNRDEDYVMNASKFSNFESRHDDMPLRYRHVRCG